MTRPATGTGNKVGRYPFGSFAWSGRGVGKGFVYQLVGAVKGAVLVMLWSRWHNRWLGPGTHSVRFVRGSARHLLRALEGDQ